MDYYLLKLNLHLCIFLVFQVHLGGAGVLEYFPSRVGVQNEHYSWCWLFNLCHVTPKKTKMVDMFNKNSSFRRKKTFCIIMEVLVNWLWQNTNFQLVLRGSQDWTLMTCSPLSMALPFRAVTQITHSQHHQLSLNPRC